MLESRSWELTAEEPLVNLQEIAEIELFILKRMKEFTLGDHASVFKGARVQLRRRARLAARAIGCRRSTGRSPR